MMNSNLRPYQDLVNCHCHPENRMIPDGEKTYRCSHCGWTIEIVLQTPPDEWYQYEGNEDTSLFPLCVDCEIQTRMDGAVELPEGHQFFKVLVFACGPNERHPERLLNAYPVEITREEYQAFGPRREEIFSRLLEEVLLDDSSSEKNSLKILQRSDDHQWAELDISGLTASQREMLAHTLQVFEARGLLLQVQFNQDSVSFLVADDLRKAFSEGKRLKATTSQAVQ